MLDWHGSLQGLDALVRAAQGQRGGLKFSCKGHEETSDDDFNLSTL
jgi:hypothetical protein